MWFVDYWAIWDHTLAMHIKSIYARIQRNANYGTGLTMVGGMLGLLLVFAACFLGFLVALSLFVTVCVWLTTLIPGWTLVLLAILSLLLAGSIAGR